MLSAPCALCGSGGGPTEASAGSGIVLTNQGRRKRGAALPQKEAPQLLSLINAGLRFNKMPFVLFLFLRLKLLVVKLHL